MNRDFHSIWQKYGTLGMLLFIIVIFGSFSPTVFLTFDNLIQALLQSTINIIASFGVFFPILIAGIDLSIGSIMALTGMVTAKLLVAGVPVFLAVIIGAIVVGGFLGFFNGYLVMKTKLHPFIITLGTLSIYRGLTLIISDARPVYGLPDSFTSGIAGWIGFIPIAVMITIVLGILLAFITNKTKFGRNVYAMGGNKEAAWFSGINVRLHTILVFVISGICGGIAGVVLTARLGSAEPLAGTGFELFAIAGAIIGGTSFFGGKGRILGVFLGALIIGVINNGLNILSVPTYYQQIVMGSLIIITVAMDSIFGRKKND